MHCSSYVFPWLTAVLCCCLVPAAVARQLRVNVKQQSNACLTSRNFTD
jgi:hypothetical protein